MAVAFNQILPRSSRSGHVTKYRLADSAPSINADSKTVLLCYDIKPISVTGAEKKSQGYRGMQYNRFQ
jgi:hypothetical protein